MSPATRPHEDELVARYFRPLATDPGAFRLGDDCATLSPPDGTDLVLKTDAVAAGIHFFADDPWDLVAKKALRVNLSDLAAKGARPLGYLLSIALPADWREDQLAAFSRGLAEDQAAFGVSLLGGDTIRSPDGLVVSITVLGGLPRDTIVRRGGARPGDVLYVSGTLGDSALGLALRLEPAKADAWGLSSDERDHLARRYLLPEPRLPLAEAVRRHASASMDISDGLGLDLTRMTRVSKVTATVETARLPLSTAARRALGADAELIGRIVGGGDDYEILAAIPPSAVAGFEAEARAAGVAVTPVGTVGAADTPPSFLAPDGTALVLGTSGFAHF